MDIHALMSGVSAYTSLVEIALAPDTTLPEASVDTTILTPITLSSGLSSLDF